MKKRLMGVSVPVLALAIGFLALSCAPGPQNGNISQNQGLAPPTPTPSPTPDEDEPNAPECNGTDLATLRNNVQTRLDRSPVADLVKFDVRVAGTALEVYVENKPATGARRVPRNRTKMLDNVLKKVMKGGCVTRVIFVAPGTLPLAEKQSVEGFEWGCNDPNVLCSNGECKLPSQCPNGMIPEPTPPANANMNTNANANSNANRGGNN